VLRRLDQALGAVPEPIEPCRPPAGPVSRIRFAGPTDRIEVIGEAIDRLLALFCEQLTHRAIGVRQLLCTFYHEEAAPTTLEVGLSRPSRSAKHLRSLLIARIESSPPGAPVLAMMLWSRVFENMDDAQACLFDLDDGPRDENEFTVLVDRLSNRLGTDAVVRPELVEDHQPEHAYRYVPVLESGKTKRRKTGKAVPHADPLAQADVGAAGVQRPLRLLTRPVEVRAMAIVPDGPPTWFRWDGREHAVVEAVGPERIETGWWRGHDVRRDYFVVLSQTGRRFWLFRHRGTGRWFVHGSFD